MHFPLSIFGNQLQLFDKDMLLTAHVQNICKGCFVQLRDFRQIRQFVSDECAILIANALVSSRLDYCNPLFRSLSTANKLKLQDVQNTLARIVTRHTKFSSTPLLKKLHWLPIRYRSIFKTATIVYKFLHTRNQSYLSKSISLRICPYVTRRGKSDNMFLNVPLFSPSVYTSKKQFGHNYPLMDQLYGTISQETCALPHPSAPFESNLKHISLQSLPTLNSNSLASLWLRPWLGNGL